MRLHSLFFVCDGTLLDNERIYLSTWELVVERIDDFINVLKSETGKMQKGTPLVRVETLENTGKN